jgi:hypothetical protein
MARVEVGTVLDGTSEQVAAVPLAKKRGRVIPDGPVSAARSPDFRFSGHETFPIRYSWLPKAIAMIGNPKADFGDDAAAMVDMGLGKNMVRALRFWVQAAGAEVSEGRYRITRFGNRLLSEDGGLDPFLEDARTLWLLHWKLSQ